MQTIKQMGFWQYFYWLVYFVTVGLVIGFVWGLDHVGNHISWLDFLATYALLGTLAILIGVLGAALLAGVEAFTARHQMLKLKSIPGAIIFILNGLIWLALLLMIGLTWHWIRPLQFLVLLVIGLVLAVVLFARYPKAILQWIAETSHNLKIITWFTVPVCLILTAYLFIEPLNKGRLAPVVLDRKDGNLPNVVVIVLDSISAQDMSLYGYPLPTTPNLDRLAETWTVYENAHTAGTSTLTMLPVALTGRYPYLDEWYRYGNLTRQAEGWMSLGQILQTEGYETICLTIGPWPPGFYHFHTTFNKIIEGEPDLPDLLNFTSFLSPILTSANTIVRSSISGSSATVMIGTFSDSPYESAKKYFQQKAQKQDNQPFFVFLHAVGAHYPYDSAEFLGTFLPKGAGLADFESRDSLASKPYPPDQQAKIDQLRLRYDESILKADDQVHQVVETLRSLHLYDNTLIIITADHGQNFMNGYQGNATPLLSAAEHHVPLLVKYPGQNQGQRVAGLVSNIDIMPTILDVIGASYPAGWTDGESLQQARTDNERVIYVRLPNDPLAEVKPTLAAISGDWELVSRQGNPFLYNLAKDPNEQNNLWGQIQAGKLEEALQQFSRRMEFIRTGGDITQAPALIDQLVR